MINVTQPFLPPLEEFIPYLEKIWESKWLTNGGQFHQELETKIADFLGVPFVVLFNNGTNALITAIQALDLSGEIITTPYTFIASANALIWNNLTPVFVDIDPISCNISSKAIENAITNKTSAIMGVHVYGNPCDIEKIAEIGEKNKLKVIYDAAHAFGVKYKDSSVLNFGDLSVLSFHATKVFNTFEGGAVICHTSDMKNKLNTLKNFGLEDEMTVNNVGLNGKMNEVQAAMGLLQLEYVSNIISKRKIIGDFYFAEFKNINGIDVIEIPEHVEWNYSYFPIFINEQKFGLNRDQLFDILKKAGFLCRKYFFPIISEFQVFQKYNNQKLINAKDIASKVLCLPIYPDLNLDLVTNIISIITGSNR